jgi:hypothetical protein
MAFWYLTVLAWLELNAMDPNNKSKPWSPLERITPFGADTAPETMVSSSWDEVMAFFQQFVFIGRDYLTQFLGGIVFANHSIVAVRGVDASSYTTF